MSLDPQTQDLKYSGQILAKLALLQVKIPTKNEKHLTQRRYCISSEIDARATMKVFKVIQWQLLPPIMCHNSN